MKTPERRLADGLARCPMFVPGKNLFATPPEPYSRKSHKNSDDNYEISAHIFASGGTITNFFNYEQPDVKVNLTVIIRSKQSSYTKGKKAVMAAQEEIRRGGFEVIYNVQTVSGATYLGKDEDDFHIWSIPVEAGFCIKRVDYIYGQTASNPTVSFDLDPFDSFSQSLVCQSLNLNFLDNQFFIAGPDDYMEDVQLYSSNGNKISSTSLSGLTYNGEPYTIVYSDSTFTGSKDINVY